MRRTSTLSVSIGDRLEFWAKGTGAVYGGEVTFRLSMGDHRLFQLTLPPSYFDGYAYTFYRAGPVEMDWDDESIAFSLAYIFNPATLEERGVTYLSFASGEAELLGFDRWPHWYGADKSRPTLRFSPFQGWMNDPNGLCRVGDTYHLFYQFNPNGTEWGPMHWGHATSKDLFAWVHYPVFLRPEANLDRLGATGGAFSGSSFVNPAGDLQFYLTERLPAYDLYSGYKEVQKRVIADQALVAPVESRVVLDIEPPGAGHDFRDPKVWIDKLSGSYRMIVGGAMHGEPAVLLFASPGGLDWRFHSVLYQAPARFRENGARCVECPDFFQIDGNWVLVMGFVGFTEPETGRHNLTYAAIGSFVNDVFTPRAADLQELDFGTDYYAMQSFTDGSRQLAFAWLYNWEFRKPAGSLYSGEMSLPRELGIDAQSRLTMRPERGHLALREHGLEIQSSLGVRPRLDAATEVMLSGQLQGIRIAGTSSSGTKFSIWETAGSLHINVPEDDSRIVYRSAPMELRHLQIFFDHGVIEIFANDGAVCGTRRSYQALDMVSLDILPGPATTIDRLEAWACRSAWAR